MPCSSAAATSSAYHAQRTNATLRGVNPDLATHYRGKGGLFSCINVSKTISFDRVNDDFCDCADGSDEPGTSACNTGTFYCRNKGHEPQQLSSSFVDDGICDCCDGSDESSGCKNTCLDKSAGIVSDLKQKVATHASALLKRNEAISQAKLRRQGWGARKDTIEHDILVQSAAVAAALEVRSKAEDEHAEAEEAARKAEDAARQERQRRQAAADEEEWQRSLQEQAAADEAGAQQADHQQDLVTNQDTEHVEETVEERGRRIASQWTTDPDAAAAAADAVAEPEEAEEPELPAANEFDEAEREAQLRLRELSKKLNDAKQQVTAAEAAMNALLKEQDDMQRYSAGHQYDFGPNEVFFPLAGRCISDPGSGWVYEACFFTKATQSQMAGQPAISLGNWKGFSDDYTLAYFESGDVCPGDVARNFTVHLVCGEQEQMYGSNEPSTCVYEAWLMTPLACSDEEMQSLTLQIKQLEQQRAQLQAEIEAEAAHDEL